MTRVTQAPAQTGGKAVTVKTTFSRETTIQISIRADAAIIWALLTSASDYPRWNTTVVSIEGSISKGEKIKLRSVLNPKRMFKLTVREFEAGRRMVWGGGQGSRVYTLKENSDGTVTFLMTEKIGGLLFPMYAKMIPPFDESFETFETFAACLKKEAELINHIKNEEL